MLEAGSRIMGAASMSRHARRWRLQAEPPPPAHAPMVQTPVEVARVLADEVEADDAARDADGPLIV